MTGRGKNCFKFLNMTVIFYPLRFFLPLRHYLFINISIIHGVILFGILFNLGRDIKNSERKVH